MNNKKINIVNSSGVSEEVDLVTYLVSDDNQSKYLVYTKGEKQGDAQDQIIYISKIVGDNKLDEITDDIEWSQVQKLLKVIANA